jgi:hypothetical protein
LRKIRNIVPHLSPARRRPWSTQPPRPPARRSTTPTPGSSPPSGKPPRSCDRAIATRSSRPAASRPPYRSWLDSPLVCALCQPHHPPEGNSSEHFQLAGGGVSRPAGAAFQIDVSHPLLVASDGSKQPNSSSRPTCGLRNALAPQEEWAPYYYYSCPPSGKPPRSCDRAIATRSSRPAASRPPYRSWRDNPLVSALCKPPPTEGPSFRASEARRRRLCPDRPVRPSE